MNVVIVNIFSLLNCLLFSFLKKEFEKQEELVFIFYICKGVDVFDFQSNSKIILILFIFVFGV